MAHQHLPGQNANVRRRLPPAPPPFAVHPSRESAGAEIGRAEQVVHPLGDPVLGNELLDVEIDRRRANAPAILRRRCEAWGKLGLASRSRRPHGDRSRAGLVFGDLDEPFRADRTPVSSPPVSIAEVNPAWQRRRASALCWSVRIRATACLSVSPLWPFCPPPELFPSAREGYAHRQPSSLLGSDRQPDRCANSGGDWRENQLLGLFPSGAPLTLITLALGSIWLSLWCAPCERLRRPSSIRSFRPVFNNSVPVGPWGPSSPCFWS